MLFVWKLENDDSSPFGAPLTDGKNQKKPNWLKIKMPGGSAYGEVKRTLNSLRLHTVCEEASCPNLGECWGQKTATFMILGDTCTRGCGFCSVNRGAGPHAVDRSEPLRVREASESIGLSHVVVTSVTRDDLLDGGASLFAQTVREIRQISQHRPTVELLIPDYIDESLATVLRESPDVTAHNIETVERLTPILRHPRFSFERSLRTLNQAKEYRNDLLTKSSIMLGLGETEDEVMSAMRRLREAKVDILVLGQYLRPARANIEVKSYIPVETFSRLADLAVDMGFGFVAAHPLARTSHRAKEALSAIRAERAQLSADVP
jgi:lipoic acid synthetase